MKQTLLDLTQSILSNLSSDEVNSISDTTESLQVAEIVRQTYYNIISRVGIPNHKQLIQLNPSLDETAPVVMYIPEGISRIEWLKYFNSNILDTSSSGDHDINTDIVASDPVTFPPPPGYTYVTILPVTQFIDMVVGFNPMEDNVESFTFSNNVNGFNSSYTFYYKNDRQPSYCTILGNHYVVFDSYDSTQDTTLQANKSMALGEVIPHFTMEDDFVPNLTDEQFTLLLNEAKSLAFFELKQMVHTKAEQEAKRGWTSVQKTKSVVERPTNFDALPDFGRVSTRVGYYRNGYTGYPR